jgi:hypothetical protein
MVDSRFALPGFVEERKQKGVHGICGQVCEEIYRFHVFLWIPRPFTTLPNFWAVFQDVVLPHESNCHLVNLWNR